MGKFKVGDHVKGTNENYYGVTNGNLIDAEVFNLHENKDLMCIKCIRFLDGNKKYIGREYCVEQEYFDYADGYSPVSVTASSFVINGQEYTNEQFEKDCKRFLEAFPEKDLFDLSYAMENILMVYKWAQQNPVVTNLDHYAEEFGWTEEKKKNVLEHMCPFPFMGNLYDFCPKQSSDNYIPCRECCKWWSQEWRGGKA